MDEVISLEEFRERYFGYVERLKEDIKREVFVKCGKYNEKDIIWLVIDVRNDNEVLLLSEKALCKRPYNAKDGNVSWEGSSLYRWLNNDFLSENVAKWEGNEIYKAIVDLPRETLKIMYFLEEFNVNSPVNKVTLLSKEQVEKIFNISKDRKSDAAKCYFFEDGSAISWWLLSQGALYRAYYINEVGRLCSDFLTTTNCVRPAMWVDLSKM